MYYDRRLLIDFKSISLKFSVLFFRTELLNCENDVDFCVKVYCLRRAFKVLNKQLNKNVIMQIFLFLYRNLYFKFLLYQQLYNSENLRLQIKINFKYILIIFF